MFIKTYVDRRNVLVEIQNKLNLKELITRAELAKLGKPIHTDTDDRDNSLYLFYFFTHQREEPCS